MSEMKNSKKAHETAEARMALIAPLLAPGLDKETVRKLREGIVGFVLIPVSDGRDVIHAGTIGAVGQRCQGHFALRPHARFRRCLCRVAARALHVFAHCGPPFKRCAGQRQVCLLHYSMICGILQQGTQFLHEDSRHRARRGASVRRYGKEG